MAISHSYSNSYNDEVEHAAEALSIASIEECDVEEANTARGEFRIPLEIAPSLTIDIIGYNMIVEELPEVRQTIDNKYDFNYCGTKVTFSDDETAQILYVREPSILVLGFKQKKSLKAHYQVSHLYFIYPDETQFTNSNSVFFSLMDAMLERDRIAICSFVRRKNSMPKIAALIPQAERLDENGDQIDPPGFILIILPYADEILPLPPANNTVEVDEECVEAPMRIMNKLKIEDFNIKNYSNSDLQNHSALELNTSPNGEFTASELSDDIEAFKKSVDLDNTSMEED